MRKALLDAELARELSLARAQHQQITCVLRNAQRCSQALAAAQQQQQQAGPAAGDAAAAAVAGAGAAASACAAVALPCVGGGGLGCSDVGQLQQQCGACVQQQGELQAQEQQLLGGVAGTAALSPSGCGAAAQQDAAASGLGSRACDLAAAAAAVADEGRAG